MCKAGDGGPTAIHTMFGWVLSGQTVVADSKRSSTNLVTTHVVQVDAQPEPLNDQLKAFWELETLGVRLDERRSEESCVNIKLVEGR